MCHVAVHIYGQRNETQLVSIEFTLAKNMNTAHISQYENSEVSEDKNCIYKLWQQFCKKQMIFLFVP